jgi:prepilin-type N-terminal cleavage/methylation domain-containing protein
MLSAPSSARRGFTLLEMSVVIAIIGLIISGTLVGRSILEQARVNRVITDVKIYTDAIRAFRQKYNGLPGDLPNATAYWGFAGGNSGDNYTVSCYSFTGSGTQTCNGNGDGQVTYWAGSGPYVYEGYRIWQHLVDAGMIQGKYTGTYGPNGIYDARAGLNMPGTSMEVGLYAFAYTGVVASNNAYLYPTVNYGHVIITDNPGYGGNYPFTPAQSLSLDMKIDDGLPASGIVLGIRSGTGNSCATTDNMANSVTVIPKYNISVTTPQCNMNFLTGL